jgi:hypothetical protein
MSLNNRLTLIEKTATKTATRVATRVKHGDIPGHNLRLRSLVKWGVRAFWSTHDCYLQLRLAGQRLTRFTVAVEPCDISVTGELSIKPRFSFWISREV